MTPSDEQVREEAAYVLGVQACLWGRPLVEYHKTTAAALHAGGVRVNAYRYFDDRKTAADRFVVTPNNVTLDAYCLADLRVEPLVISVPALTEDRWYIVQISDHYDEIVTNIGGYRGPQPGLYVVTGPDHHGRIPLGMTEIKVRTYLAANALRVLVRGDTDLASARSVLHSFRAMPLSMFERHGLSFTDPVESQEDVVPPFDSSAPEELRMLDHLGLAMKLLLPTSEGTSDTFIRQLAGIHLTVAGGFARDELDDAARRGLARATTTAEAIIDHAYLGAATEVDGWRYTLATGRAGHDFALRAAFVKYLLGANVPEQLLYPNTRVDGDADPLSGENRYVLRFDAGQLPPVSVFWNVCVYDADELFVENDFGRYSIGSTTDGLTSDPDGSITILIQHDRPDETANWLPAPLGPFNLTMRLYGAQNPILEGTYRLPPVQKVT
jgi:hypothetical protein